MRVVTVHRGARDAYQVALALEECGLLETLVTDLYWPADRSWAQTIESAVPRISRYLRSRYAKGLPSAAVKTRAWSGLISLCAHKLRWLPSRAQSSTIRWCDHDLGHAAARAADRRGSALLSYSYYGHSAFSRYRSKAPRILFQLHPHPAAVRSILRRERELHPECAASLDSEWELLLPENDFTRLVEEVPMAEAWIVASSFTKHTLVAEGMPAEKISVVPYGVDLDAFSFTDRSAAASRPLRLLFVGTLGQRKGIKYLLQALRLVPAGSVELTLCGRPVDDLAWIRNEQLPIRVIPSASVEQLHCAYREADVFVFPSLAEGFGHVLLEAMASGLPIISTDRTAASDLIQNGQQGYIVSPGSAQDIAAAIIPFLNDRERGRQMGKAARHRAQQFTWSEFRRRVARVVAAVLTSAEPRQSILSCSPR